ncbi:transposable element Tc1 transposase [Trichonephila clavipes]|uniref:Transposable element Tc1 transposase n=1 Tax=Trichonephila clavipes TaxID=2585209 RepID=A0A8X6RWL4_TRICX|nr:transposable element Tc1 transposase [Trichonephila clavipes]
MGNDGKSRQDIVGSVGRQYSSIQHVIYNLKSARVYSSKPRSGRPSKLTIREKRSMTSMMKKNPCLTVTQIATDICEKLSKNIWANTARKILKKTGYRSRVVRRKPYISMTNRLKRIVFAKYQTHKPLKFWRTVIFSDEGKFCIFGIKGRKLVWKKRCTSLQKQHLVPTVKYGGGGVMVWGCMAGNEDTQIKNSMGVRMASRGKAIHPCQTFDTVLLLNAVMTGYKSSVQYIPDICQLKRDQEKTLVREASINLAEHVG